MASSATNTATRYSWRRRRSQSKQSSSPTVQSMMSAVTQRVDAPMECKYCGNVAFSSGDYAAAISHYRRGLDLLAHDDIEQSSQLLCVLWSNTSQCHIETEHWWEAIFAAHCACGSTIGGQEPTKHELKAGFRYAIAAGHLGLLTVAETLFDKVVSNDGANANTAARTQLAKVRARLAALNASGGSKANRTALSKEVKVLESALGEEKAFEVRQTVEVNVLSEEGLKELLRRLRAAGEEFF